MSRLYPGLSNAGKSRGDRGAGFSPFSFTQPSCPSGKFSIKARIVSRQLDNVSTIPTHDHGIICADGRTYLVPVSIVARVYRPSLHIHRLNDTLECSHTEPCWRNHDTAYDSQAVERMPIILILLVGRIEASAYSMGAAVATSTDTMPEERSPRIRRGIICLPPVSSGRRSQGITRSITCSKRSFNPGSGPCVSSITIIDRSIDTVKNASHESVQAVY